MSKRCNHIKANGFRCGSGAFNLWSEGIEQGNLCDVHYWQDQAQKARADEREACARLAEKLTWADNRGVADFIRETRGNT